MWKFREFKFKERFLGNSKRECLDPWKLSRDTCHEWLCATVAYLEDLGCLGTALVELLGGEVDFRVMDGFEVVLVDECTLVLENVKGFFLEGGGGGAGALRGPIDSNRSFPVTSNLRMFLAAWETFRHILDLGTRLKLESVLIQFLLLIP